MVKVSVIVPVYNTESYLGSCLDSVLNQTLGDIEIIAVNNGSTDQSPKILETYQKRYPDRIKVIYSEIADLSSARNLGLTYAQGDYIAYLDSDDYVHPTMYEKLYLKAVQGGFDLVVCDMFYSYTRRNMPVSSGVQEDIQERADIRQSITTVHPAAWNKLFKRSLVEGDIRFAPFVYFEDFEFLYRLYPLIQSIGVVKEPLIYYRQREGSITHVFDKRLYAFITNFDSILAHYHQSGDFQEYQKELEYLYVRYAFATMIRRMSQMGDHKAYVAGVKYARQCVKKVFPSYKKNELFYKGPKGIYLLLFSQIVAEAVYALEAIRGLKKV